MSFVLSALAIYISHDVYHQYFDFFYYGHLRGKDVVGALMISFESFTQAMAAINFLFSPIYFWFVPAEGFASRYDSLIYLGNGFLFINFISALFSFNSSRLINDRFFVFPGLFYPSLCLSRRQLRFT